MFEQFLAEIHRTLEAPEPGQVHDLRVSIRRLNQALAVFDPGKNVTVNMRRAVKRIMKLAGAVRDCDITLELVIKAGAAKRLQTRLHRRRGNAERALLNETQNWTGAHTGETWRKKLASIHAGNATQAIAKALKKLFKRGKEAETHDKMLHPLRIAAKKLRYTLELDAVTGSPLDTIKELQTRLGDINDYESARRLASQESASKSVLKALAKKRKKKIRAFHRFWRSEFAGRRKEWKNKIQAAPSRSHHGERQGAA